MKKQLTPRSILLMVVFLAILIYYLISTGIISFDSSDSDNLFGLSVGGPSSSALTAREASKFRTSEPLQAVIWKSGWESDPFYYAEAETTDAMGGGIIGSLFGTLEGEGANLSISGISWNGNIGMALINGDILEEGDRVSGYQITKIAFDHVILRRGTSIVKVSLDD